MRGTLFGCHPRRVVERFIPAYAGNTQIQDIGSGCSTVHPRVCGEHLQAAKCKGVDSGSSPRMRGTQRRPEQCVGLPRFIPAYAGNTGRPSRRTGGGPVHPRVCGEHAQCVSKLLAVRGSSPRMRGTRSAGRPRWAASRFIPAYAGNTPGSGAAIRPCPVHPRVCGEHLKSPISLGTSSGSSPRMRGTRSAMRLRRKPNRFIPAYAGNTPRQFPNSH